MARALQCPDCGHREPLDNVVDFDQFRCHGCGRALKVPVELRQAQGADATDLAGPAMPPTPPEPADDPVPTRVLARASETDLIPGGASPETRSRSRVERAAQAATAPGERLPLAARLAVWVLWLPLGLGFTYLLALKLDWITQDDLIETVGEVTWDRFMPIARIIPLAALLVAVLVHVTITGLERWLGNRRRTRVTSPVAPGST